MSVNTSREALASALLYLLDGEKPHDINEAALGIPQTECDRINAIRAALADEFRTGGATQQNTMTQGSIDKIYRHAGKLATIIELMSTARRALDDLDETRLMEVGERLAEIHSATMSNDLGDIFKQFYNRQRSY